MGCIRSVCMANYVIEVFILMWILLWQAGAKPALTFERSGPMRQDVKIVRAPG
jgi:hypothetical protein